MDISKSLENARQWFSRMRKPRVLILTGPTCIGKTAISIELARQLNGEVISADSVQVYRTLDIGSSKVNVLLRSESLSE